MISYKTRGALEKADEELYIVRPADEEILGYIARREYVLIQAPRQQGTTSLLNRLIYKHASTGALFVYFNYSELDGTSEGAWYRAISSKIINQLRRAAFTSIQLREVTNHSGWRALLTELTVWSQAAGRHVVIVFDQLDETKFDGSDYFYQVIREYHSLWPAQQRVSFILAGMYRVKEILQDEMLSPFNVAEALLLPDFTAADVLSLVQMSGNDAKTNEILAGQIYSYTNGHPYLTQALCHECLSGALQVVGPKVRLLAEYDKLNIWPLVMRLEEKSELKSSIRTLLKGAQIRWQGFDSPYHELERVGAVNLVDDIYSVRNELYRIAFEGMFSRTTAERAPIDTSVNLRLLDQLDRGNVVGFFGAGLSMSCGLPKWEDLVLPLMNAANPGRRENPTVDEMLRFLDTMTHDRLAYLIDYLSGKLNIQGARPSKVHELITRLPLQTIFTTNYDNLIEDAFKERAALGTNQVSPPHHVIVTAKELSQLNKNQVQVVKLCGDLNHLEEIVISHRQFNSYMDSHKYVYQFLMTTLFTSTPLFIGYSLRDPFINQLWDRIGSDLGPWRRPGFAIMFAESVEHAKYFSDDGIEVINLPGDGDKTETLRKYLAQYLK